MKLNPPRLSRGPLSGRVYVITHGHTTVTDDGRELITATTKYDVTDQLDALTAEGSE